MAVGEWDQRQLCPDGGCVGVIGPDGTCRVCGRAALNWGDERKRGLIDPPEDDELDAGADKLAADPDDELDDGDELDEGEDEDDGDDDLHDGEPADGELAQATASPYAASAPALPADWNTRRLCPDGSCIGLLGIDGQCKVCGCTESGAPRAATPSPPTTAEDGSAAPSSEPAGEPASAAATGAGDPESKERTRCADSTCPGMRGPDGLCEACGKVVA